MQVPREGWRCWVCPGGVPTPSASSWHPRVAWASDSPPQVSCIRTTSPICRESWGTPLPWKLYMAVKWNGTERQPGETSGYQESLLLPALPFLTLSDDHAAHMAKQNQCKTNVKTTACHRSQCRPSLAPKGPPFISQTWPLPSTGNALQSEWQGWRLCHSHGWPPTVHLACAQHILSFHSQSNPARCKLWSHFADKEMEVLRG